MGFWGALGALVTQNFNKPLGLAYLASYDEGRNKVITKVWGMFPFFFHLGRMLGSKGLMSLSHSKKNFDETWGHYVKCNEILFSFIYWF